MFFYFVVFLCSLTVCLLSLNHLVQKFYDSDVTEKKINVVSRIRWGDSKKSHLGGLSFLITLVFTNIFLIVFYKDFFLTNYRDLIYFSSIILLAGFFGFLDEKYSYKPLEKITLQIIISILLILNGKIINFSPNEIINISITIFYFVAIFNILNMFDNIDLGFASISLPIIIFLMSLNIHQGNTIILLSFLGSIIAFTYFNSYPSKIFMGDLGSFQLAVLFSAISINIFWSDYKFNGYVTSLYQLGLQNIIFLLPIADFVIVTLKRISEGKSIFTGDTNHISHIFNLKIKNINLLGLVFLFILIGLIFCFYCINNFLIPGKHSLFIIVLFYILFIGLIYYLYRLSNNDR